MRMLGQVSGTRDGALWPGVGHEIDLPADEAATLVQSRMAIPVVDPQRAALAVAPVADVEERGEVHTDPAVAPSNEARAAQRSALVKGRRKNVNPDVA